MAILNILPISVRHTGIRLTAAFARMPRHRVPGTIYIVRDLLSHNVIWGAMAAI
ncbi:hypothetical protein [Pseudoxanthobacter sp.]|uniref:hypothetical protein n=1 Tax=Pseudoxanthobacter sp. TaxID=1925742 RepID=UPI002FE36C05